MDENRPEAAMPPPELPAEPRPTTGGSYVRLPDGSLVPEDEWLAAQQAAPVSAAPQALSDPPPPPPPADPPRTSRKKDA